MPKLSPRLTHPTNATNAGFGGTTTRNKGDRFYAKITAASNPPYECCLWYKQPTHPLPIGLITQTTNPSAANWINYPNKQPIRCQLY